MSEIQFPINTTNVLLFLHLFRKMGHSNINKTLLEQISEGQIQWNPLEDEFDVVSIGYDENMRQYPVVAGNEI